MLARILSRLPAFSERLLRVVLVAGAVLFVAVYLVLAAVHLRYPFELEWMEGGAVDHVRWILSGHRLYVKPTLDFVPFIYTPLYFYVCAAFAKVLGAGFFSMRLVSVLASIGCLTLIGGSVFRETKSRLAAVVALGLFAGTYRASVAFMDLARVDSLALLFYLGGLYVLRFRSEARYRIVAALLFCLSFLTKQSMLVGIAPLGLYPFFTDGRRRGFIFGAAVAAGVGLSVLVLDRLHEGWFRYYVFWIPSLHPRVQHLWYDYWVEDLLPLAISFVAGLFWLAQSGEEAKGARPFWVLSAGGALATSWGGRLHAGGWPNVLMPAHALLAILFGLGIGAALEALESLPASRRLRLRMMVLGVGLMQLAVLVYHPRRYVPTAKDAQAGRDFVAKVGAVSGEVWMPAHGYLSSLAGKRTFAHEMAMNDLIGVGGGAPGEALKAEVVKALADKRFGAVVPDTDFFKDEIGRSYARSGELFRDGSFFPVTGMRTRPRGIFLPRMAAPGPREPLKVMRP